MKSRIVMQNGKTEIEVEGKVITTAAYVTYFTENNDYQGFTEAGYDLYSICTYFTSLPINEGSGFTPARIGIFDTKGVEDFSELDKDMADLLAINKNAMVFPRIYVSMPLWWLRENPSECVPVDMLKEGREMLFSEKFRHDSGEMLKKFIAHCQNAPYANSIIGYQISGGSTQEWFHFGQRGSYCENAYAYFIGFMEKNHPEAKATRDDFFPENEKYVRFANESVVETVEYLSKIAKECTNYEQIIGAFYGYTVEVFNPLRGTHALKKIIDSPYVDFFCSPFSYNNSRELGEDWVTMLAEDSISLHNKKYITEADVRTHLSKYPDECRKSIKLLVPYRGTIWHGGPTEELAVYQVRKAFAKLLTHSRGFWWFDMWGGWYVSEGLRKEMRMFRKLADMSSCENVSKAKRIAVFVDEDCYARYPDDSFQWKFLLKLAHSGIAYDLYLLDDLDDVQDKYPLLLLPQYDEIQTKKEIRTKCLRGLNATLDEIRSVAQEAGVHIFAKSNDCIFAGNGFLALHACTEGKKEIILCDNQRAEVLTDHKFKQEGNRLTFEIKRFDTVIFRTV